MMALMVAPPWSVIALLPKPPLPAMVAAEWSVPALMRKGVLLAVLETVRVPGPVLVTTPPVRGPETARSTSAGTVMVAPPAATVTGRALAPALSRAVDAVAVSVVPAARLRGAPTAGSPRLALLLMLRVPALTEVAPT